MDDGIVGRRRELGALRRWLGAARDGAGRLVLCVGEPGIGLARDVKSPEDRFRVFDDVTEVMGGVADKSGLVVILDDIHPGDESSLLLLRHLADQLADARLLVFAAFRDVEPESVLPRLLPDLLRSPAVGRL